jgi:hypothetical protein
MLLACSGSGRALVVLIFWFLSDRVTEMTDFSIEQ